MTRGWKIVVGIVGGVVAVNVGLSALQDLTGGSPGGPAGSSYATGGDGAAAWAELLSRAGHRVERLRVTPSEAELDPHSTAVVLDAPFVLARDAEALGRFVEGGGRLVVAGSDDSWVEDLVGGELERADAAVDAARPLAPVPETAGVRSVRSAGGAWSETGGALPALGDREATLAAVASPGAGRVVLLADASPLENAYLERDDNARLALALAGAPDRPVTFLETYHGYGRSSGFGAVPARWRALLALLALAAVVFVASRFRRLGPPEPEGRELDPPRREYVEALAGSLERTHEPAAALADLKAEARRRLARRTGAAADDAAAQSAARRLGLPDDEAAAVTRETLRGEDVVPLGRALARLAGAGGRDDWQA